MSSVSDLENSKVFYCDADTSIESLYRIVTSILRHVSTGESLCDEYRALINAYHSRYAVCPCNTNFSPSEVETYHLKLIIAVFKLYYGPDYSFSFVADLPFLEEELLASQMKAMFPDESLLYQVQCRLVQAGIMKQLPRFEDLAL